MNRLTFVVAIGVTSLLLSGCIPPEPDTDLIVDYDPEETVMGAIQQRGELVVGIPARRQPFGSFTSGLGELVADALGVEAAFEGLPPDELLHAPNEGAVDISFPLITITEKLVRRFAFTDPIYIAHQRLLVEKGSAVRQVDDLSGVVCQFITREVHKLGKGAFTLSPIGANVKELNPDIVVLEPPEIEGCLKDLDRGRVEAVTASDWLLYPALAAGEGLTIVGDDLTTEAYGAVVESEASAWFDLVNGVLARADAEGDWQRLFDESFGPYVTETITYPDMTVEEAAALFPADL